MTDPISDNYYRITHGIPMATMRTHEAARLAAHAAIDQIAVRYGAVVGRFLSFGLRVYGLQFSDAPGSDWRQVRDHPGFYRPNPRTKGGKEIRSSLEAISFPDRHRLSANLGCKTFIRRLGSDFMVAVGYLELDGAFYITVPRETAPSIVDGIEQIRASEYFAANEALEAKL